MSKDRREFLKALGATAAAVAGTGCGVGAAESVAGITTAAAADATVPVGTDEEALISPRRTTIKYGVELDGTFAGWVQSAEGGGAVGDVVTEKQGPDGISKKHLAGVKYEDITVNCGTGMSKAFYQWIQDTLGLKGARKNGAIIESDFNARERSRMEFTNALISEVGLPALDASSRATAKMTLKITPEFTRLKAGSGGQIKFESSFQVKWRTSDFKLKIDGLDDATSRALKIEAITIKQKVVENPIGENRDPAQQPAGLDFSDLAVSVADSHAKSFYDWHQDFVIQGNNGDDQERSGTLDYLDSRLRPLFTLTFSHLGIYRLDKQSPVARDQILTVKGEMYVERIGFATAGSGNSD